MLERYINVKGILFYKLPAAGSLTVHQRRSDADLADLASHMQIVKVVFVL